MAPLAPSGPALRPGEEEWQGVFQRLCERFPSTPAERVASILRKHGGHAGSAASELRDLTSDVVRQPDPDDAQHVATLLSSPDMFGHACKENFRKFDVSKKGTLDWEEVYACTTALYEKFGLDPPSEGSVKAFFHATDENGDGVLNEKEFKKFFECFLRYAFFDVVKLRQIIEKGQIWGTENNSQQQQRGRQTAEPTSGAQQSQRSPSDARQQQRQSHHRSSSGKAERGAGVLPGSTLRCAVPHGVSYRASPDLNDRTDTVMRQGETVQVLEHWVKTPNGWLPLTDSKGHPLFERASGNAAARSTRSTSGGSRENSQPAAAEVRERHGEGELHRAEDTAGAVNFNTAGDGELRPGEEEWKDRMERLLERFPKATKGQVLQALRDNDGHAGAAASTLRAL
eukprot:gnl/MRDRNA2_/MRDRNA2_62566_c0_seq1.p1 gnl/MRDRNA2_/MRDRNA2_62566_c0~~gnl/MRDRNA2_/MRDRNA2_62566_c0_seq1.p1  ORF type:complete len:420 (+),score=80.72 gnl/MRDRNA2_/MRDRNA2_62566_c0_seq1:64-1260(+)